MTPSPMMRDITLMANLPARLYLRWCEDFWGTWIAVYFPERIGNRTRE